MSCPPLLRVVSARVRLFARHHRLAYWIVAGAAAATIAVSLAGLAADLEDRRSAWTPGGPVLIIDRSVEAGTAVPAAAVQAVSAPAALIPAGALSDLPVGARATVDLVAGEILVAGRVLDPSATAAPDTRRITLARSPVTPPVAVGSRVDLVVTDERTTLASDLLVAGLDDTRLVLEVPADRAPDLAATVAVRDVVVVLR